MSMDKKSNEELLELVDKAVSGDKKALETLIEGVQDIVFNLSLRMLGTFADAEDATQDILLNDYASVFFQGRQLLYDVGIQHCDESSEKLQKAYVRPVCAKL